MRCQKCKYITFEFYDSCPKCGADFKKLKELLNILDYSIKEENNYLIPERVVETSEKVEVQEKEPKEFKEEDLIEHTKIEESQEAEEEVDGIDLKDLLETNRFEEE